MKHIGLCSLIVAGAIMGATMFPAETQAACGDDDCVLETYGPWNYTCCLDSFAGCKKYKRRAGQCVGEPPTFGHAYAFLSTHEGSCDTSTQNCVIE